MFYPTLRDSLRRFSKALISSQYAGLDLTRDEADRAKAKEEVFFEKKNQKTFTLF
jgi:hypothetical protein